MRRTSRRQLFALAIGAMAFALFVCAAHADPAPPFTDTVWNESAYDLTVTVGPSNTYIWEVTFNDTAFPDPEWWRAFVVYDNDPPTDVSLVSGTDIAPATDVGPTPPNPAVNWKLFGGAVPYVAVEWSAKVVSADRVAPGTRLKFSAQFDGPLDDPTQTAIHIQYPDGSEWTNNTPEPCTMALLLCAAPALFAVARRKKA